MMDTALATVGFYLNVAVLTATFYAAVKLLEDMGPMHSRRLLCVAVAVCVASLGDVVTTWYGLEHAGLYEANPGAKNVLNSYGYAGMLLGKSIPAIAAIGLSGLSVRLWSDGSEWKWYAPAIALVALNVSVTAYNGMLILSA